MHCFALLNSMFCFVTNFLLFLIRLHCNYSLCRTNNDKAFDNMISVEVIEADSAQSEYEYIYVLQT